MLAKFETEIDFKIREQFEAHGNKIQDGSDRHLRERISVKTSELINILS